MVFFIADTHFGHSSIIDLCYRPFESTGEMDMFMIETWNGKVSENDTVYIIGDMFHQHKDPESVLKQLKGKKRLIIGNHDIAWMKKFNYSTHFLSADSYLEVSDGKRKLVLCHYPLMTWNHELKSYMIHGHVHNKKDAEYWPLIKNNPRLLNAGVDINGFWPVTFEQMMLNNECYKEGLHIGEVIKMKEAIDMAKDQEIKELTEQERKFCHNLLHVIFGAKSRFDEEYVVTYSRELLDMVEQHLAELPEESQAVLTMHYRDGEPMQEIGEKLNISEEEVRCYEAEGLRMMRHPSRSKKYYFQFMVPTHKSCEEGD